MLTHEGDVVPLMRSPSLPHGGSGCGRLWPQVMESSGGTCPPADGEFDFDSRAARMRGVVPCPPFLFFLCAAGMWESCLLPLCVFFLGGRNQKAE